MHILSWTLVRNNTNYNHRSLSKLPMVQSS